MTSETTSPTPELATWTERLVAHLVDLILVAVACYAVGLVLIFAFFFHEYDLGEKLVAAIAYAWLLQIVSFLLYPWIMLRRGGRRGQTIGKQALGIRVRLADGGEVTGGAVGLRDVLGKGLLFGLLAPFTLYVASVLDYLWPLWDGERRALHDMLASTRVFRS